MKKFFAFLTLALFSFSTVANAAEIEIDGAVKNDEGYVVMDCSIGDEEDNQSITVVAREYTKENDDVDGIIYIDQITPEITDGKFDYTFNVKSNFDEKNVYLLRVGGTNVETAAQKIIAVNGENVYVLGDVNSDGYIDDVDAALVLDYLAGAGTLDATQMQAADFYSDSNVDMLDAIKIVANSK